MDTAETYLTPQRSLGTLILSRAVKAGKRSGVTLDQRHIPSIHLSRTMGMSPRPCLGVLPQRGRLLLLLQHLLCFFFLAPASSSAATPTTLKITAFNVQVFGVSKMGKAGVSPVLVSVLRRSDLTLVQEVRDASGESITDLLVLVNDGLAAEDRYGLLVSARLGRTNSKEQYAWFYRTQRLVAYRQTIYADPKDEFEREPQVVWWGDKATGLNLTTIGIHAAPDDVLNELDALDGVYDELVEPSATALVLGDLNADCSYLGVTKWKCIRDPTCSTTTMRLWNPAKWNWLIQDDADTTTSASNCAYDRFVLHTPSPNGAAAPLPSVAPAGPGTVFDYGAAYGLDAALVKTVSDHYPIDLILTISNPIGGGGGGTTGTTTGTTTGVTTGGGGTTGTTTGTTTGGGAGGTDGVNTGTNSTSDGTSGTPGTPDAGFPLIPVVAGAVGGFGLAVIIFVTIALCRRRARRLGRKSGAAKSTWSGSGVGWKAGGGATAGAGTGAAALEMGHVAAEWYSAIYDYVGQGADELTFATGDRVEKVEWQGSSGWGRGRLVNGEEGMFPGNYVQGPYQD